MSEQVEASLRDLSTRVSRLPTPPVGISMIIQAAGDPTVSLNKLSQLAGREPSFVVELLRLANSPFYGIGRELRTVQQASVALGSRAIRNHAVAHVVRVMADHLSIGDLDGAQFWEDSLRRGTTAQILANTAGYEDPQEAFTVSLIQDIGVVVMAALWPEKSPLLQESMQLPCFERLQVEKRHFGLTHPQVFRRIAGGWQLPKDLVEAVSAHHSPHGRASTRRGQRLLDIARVADHVADVFQTEGSGKSVQLAHQAVASLSGRKNLSLEVIAEQVAKQLPEIASQLKIKISKQPSFEQLVSQANESLVQIADQYENLTQQLQRILREKEQLTRMLERSNAELRRLAATDDLTGVANRRRFTQAFKDALSTQKRKGKPLSLLILDLDKFKQVNDTYGHACGDDVLKEVAQRLSTMLRPSDLIGRIGGEEFGIILMGTGREGGPIAAQRFRRALGAIPVLCRDGTSVPVTGSFGGSSAAPDHYPTVDELMTYADTAMYKSKKSGRDRVTWYDELTPQEQRKPE